MWAGAGVPMTAAAWARQWDWSLASNSDLEDELEDERERTMAFVEINPHRNETNEIDNENAPTKHNINLKKYIQKIHFEGGTH